MLFETPRDVYRVTFKRGLKRDTSVKIHRVRCRYSVVNFLQNLFKRHNHSSPIRVKYGVGFFFWGGGQTVIYFLPESLQWCMQYHVVSGRIIMSSYWAYLLSSSKYEARDNVCTFSSYQFYCISSACVRIFLRMTRVVPGFQKTCCTNPTMPQSHIQQCTIL